MVIVLLAAACEKSAVEPGPPPSKASIVLTQLAVAVVPGGTEKIVAASTNDAGEVDQCTVASSDDNIVTAVITGDTILVTGNAAGSANVRVTNSDGLGRDMPITVYDPRVIEAGGIQITYVDQFLYRWHDEGSGGRHDGGFWHPVTTGGFYPLGSLGVPGYGVPTNLVAVIVVKEIDQSGAVVHPVDYTLVYTDAGSNADHDGSFWLPVPPSPDYVAMGLVAQSGYGKPALNDVVCVHKDLVIKGRAGPFIWNDDETGANMDLGTWQIAVPDAGLHDLAYIAAGTFVGWSAWVPPSDHPAMNVLKIPLPVVADGANDSYAPALTDYDQPPSTSPPSLNRSVLVPFTAINDPLRGGDIHWIVENSPFYRLERNVYHRLLYHDHNEQSVTLNQPVATKVGVEAAFGQSFYQVTGVSVSATQGIQLLGPFVTAYGFVSGRVSLELGYGTHAEIAELEYTTDTKTLAIPPDKAAAIWQKASGFVLKRHNGTALEEVGVPLETGIDRYVRSEYP
jgi:hypothetical protein